MVLPLGVSEWCCAVSVGKKEVGGVESSELCLTVFVKKKVQSIGIFVTL